MVWEWPKHESVMRCETAVAACVKLYAARLTGQRYGMLACDSRQDKTSESFYRIFVATDVWKPWHVFSRGFGKLAALYRSSKPSFLVPWTLPAHMVDSLHLLTLCFRRALNPCLFNVMWYFCSTRNPNTWCRFFPPIAWLSTSWKAAGEIRNNAALAISSRFCRFGISERFSY